MIKKRLNKQFGFEVTLTSGGTEFKDFNEDQNTDDYVPFENLNVLNTGTEDLKVFINNGGVNNFRLVPSGTILELEDQEIYNIRFENQGTNNATFTYQVNNDLSQKKIAKAMLDLELNRFKRIL